MSIRKAEMGKRKAPETPKKKRTNWSRGTPKKKMDKAIKKFEIGKFKLEAKKLEDNWDAKRMKKEISKLAKDILKASPLKGKGKTVFREKIGLDQSRKSRHDTPVGKGGKQSLTQEQELGLIKWVADRERIHIPVSKSEFKAEALLISTAPNFKASKRWLRKFLVRHPKVKLRKPEVMNTSRAQAKTEGAVRQHFKTLNDAQKLVAEKSGYDTLKKHQVGNADKKGIVTRKQGSKKVMCIASKQGPKSVSVGDLQFTVLETVWGNGEVGERLYILKGKRIPKDFDIKEFDPDGRVAMSPEGGMTKEIWRDIAAPMIVESAPARKENEWLLLSLDQYDCHVNEPVSLKYFWDHKILVFAERSQSSDMYQVCDVTCFKSLQGYLDEENLWCIAVFGGKKLTQFEYVNIYKLAADRALTNSNIKSGFKCTGIFPPMNGDQWLSIYAEKHKILMKNEQALSSKTMSSEDLRNVRRQNKLAYGNERKLELSISLQESLKI